MTTQPESLRLAEVFETYAVDHKPDGWPAIRQETLNSAAAELRRLHAENEALRVALEQPWVEAVTDEENERFSQDVSNFPGADPEATKYALEAFLKNRTIAPPQLAQQAVESGLPERNCGVPAEQQGLFRKFDVRRVDGSDQPGGKHHRCRYFVLDVDHDQHAKAALTAYANACESTHPALAADLREKWGAAPQPVQQAGVESELRQLHGALYTAQRTTGEVQAHAISAARVFLSNLMAHQPTQTTCNCRWEGDVQVQQCTLHEAHVASIHEWAERAKSAEKKLKEVAPQPDARTTAIQACIDRLIFGGQPAAAQILRHHFAKDLGEE